MELPALSADEAFVRQGLDRHFRRLASEIGERNSSKSWELAESADYLASQLEALGYSIDRQGYEIGPVAAQNLTVTVRGGQRGDEIFFVGAHYDSPPSAPGVDAALSTAALLELARMMQGANLERTLKIVFFALGESPSGDGNARGARHYARKVYEEARRAPDAGLPEAVQKASEVENFGVLTLGSLLDLGRETDAGPIVVPLSSDPSAWKIESVLVRSFHDEALEISSVPLGQIESDARPFSELGIPTIALGAGAISLASSGQVSARQLDDAARVVMRIREGLGDILIERPTNDAMVTPVGP